MNIPMAAEALLATFIKHFPHQVFFVFIVAVLRDVAAMTTNDLDDAAVDIVASALGVTSEDEDSHAKEVAASMLNSSNN